jgi:hypothetical protein
MRILMTILLTLSLLANGVFLYQHLEKAVYREGMKDGAEKINQMIVAEVIKNKRLNVKLPKGQSVVMVPQTKTNPLPTHVVIESQLPKNDPNNIGSKP